MSDTKNTIYIRLKNIREKLNLSQEEVAQRLSINRSIVAKIELGQRKLSAEELGSFSHLYNVSMEELLYGINTKEGNLNLLNRLFLQLSEYDQQDIINIIKAKLINFEEMSMKNKDSVLKTYRDNNGGYIIDENGNKSYYDDGIDEYGPYILDNNNKKYYYKFVKKSKADIEYICKEK